MAEPTTPPFRPEIGPDEAAALALDHWGIRATASPLPGDRDRNFLLEDEGGERWVLKAAGDRGADSSHLALQAEALRVVHGAWGEGGPAPFPTILPPQDAAGDGHPGVESTVRVTDRTGRSCLLRLVSYLPGTPLADTHLRPPALIRELGAALARLDLALSELPSDTGERPLSWDLRQGFATIDRYAPLIQDPQRQALLQESVAAARASMEDFERILPRGLIHNDANDHNILVEWGSDPDPAARSPRISGIIDFGDMIRTWRVAEVAIAGAYLILSRPAPLSVLEALVAGYHSAAPLTEGELAAVFPLIRLRLAISVCMSAHQVREHPDDPYLRVSEAPAWEALDRLAGISDALAEAHLRRAVGLEPSRAGEALRAWLGTTDLDPAPVLPGLGEVPIATLDLTPGSLDLADLPEGAPARAWTRVLFRRMEELGATIGIGRWDEPRRWYTSPLFQGEGPDGPAWRSVHIGIDLFAPASTPVHAPLDGVVHSAALNDGELDYGPTVLLHHTPEDGPEFFTLYGHLARESIRDLAPGTRISRGEAFAALGAEEENGGWAPHLHFQAVSDLLNYERDFPGVALPADREVWCSLSPDPAPLLGIAAPPPPRAREMEPEAIRRERDRHLGPGLSLSYRHPLKIVRGWMQYLYDHEGQTLLDGVNNVPHVGHCHPRVVEAARLQMGVLNTNTRYLHDELALYCDELQATLPDPLSVVYLVCSGSEANELALRLARAHTSRRDIIALEAGYHGNTTLLVEASDYKSGGPGGSGPGDWVHTAPLPDSYRGRYRRGAVPDPGAVYAAEVQSLLASAADSGRPIGAFLAESLPGCGGQIVLPEGYLHSAYAAVRAGGGVCIADEVQVGFGRVGSHFWGFETQGVVPDIVTLGKPIGNGHPLGAVVTTPEIAASFDTGMEYFNTFGGNPVSCAVGREVLSVIRDEALQARAQAVGGALKAGLEGLKGRHQVIGDVRGLGLYLGVELVRDRDTRAPAGPAAGYVANRMRERGILISTDGPDHNVLKIKPPLQFSADDGAALVECLDRVLAEEPLRVG